MASPYPGFAFGASAMRPNFGNDVAAGAAPGAPPPPITNPFAAFAQQALTNARENRKFQGSVIQGRHLGMGGGEGGNAANPWGQNPFDPGTPGGFLPPDQRAGTQTTAPLGDMSTLVPSRGPQGEVDSGGFVTPPGGAPVNGMASILGQAFAQQGAPVPPINGATASGAITPYGPILYRPPQGAFAQR